MQLPLWNRNQGNIEAARVELERARQDVTRTQLLTRNHAEPLAQQYQTARFTAERYRTEMLPRARRAYQLEVLKYQQMAQTYPHVLSAQRLLFTLQLGYIQALNQAWQAAIALENYTLMNALDEPMSVGLESNHHQPAHGSGRKQLMLAIISWISLGVAFACALYLVIDVFSPSAEDGDHERRLAGDRALSQRLRRLGLPPVRPAHGERCAQDESRRPGLRRRPNSATKSPPGRRLPLPPATAAQAARLRT